MADNNPMMKGIESLFDNNADKFEKEKSFGKKLYKTAWAVEILAALLGLLIAFLWLLMHITQLMSKHSVLD
tara:strand:+ start:461 stop:673 length:213 start_codon:yes stop_codon:yes gene_type:complete